MFCCVLCSGRYKVYLLVIKILYVFYYIAYYDLLTVMKLEKGIESRWLDLKNNEGKGFIELLTF